MKTVVFFILAILAAFAIFIAFIVNRALRAMDDRNPGDQAYKKHRMSLKSDAVMHVNN